MKLLQHSWSEILILDFVHRLVRETWSGEVLMASFFCFYTPTPQRGRGYTVLPLSVLPSVQDIFRRIFLSNC